MRAATPVSVATRPTPAPTPVAGAHAVDLPTGPDVAARRPPRRRRIAWAVSAGLAVASLGGFGLLLVLVRRHRTDAFDLRVSVALQRRWPRRLELPIHAASWPGFPPQSRLIPPAIITFWWWRGFRKAAVLQGVAWGTGLTSTVLKAFVRRPRPLPAQVRVFLHDVDGSSFPSGHVLTYTGFYGFFAYLVARHFGRSRGGRATVAGVAAAIGLVGPSRIHQGHHWPADVLASYLLGFAYALGLVAVYERFARAGNRDDAQPDPSGAGSPE